jgi:DNA-binding SARP family transcriptional activator
VGATATRMWFGFLGSLLVRVDDVDVAVRSGKQRVLLAALLVRRGEVVSFDELAEILWDGAPPATARPTIRNHAKRLRQVLGPGAGRIATRQPGYVAEVADDEVDLAVFARMCRDGAAAARARQWQQASSLFAGALALQRGAPLLDVPSETLWRQHVPGLEQMRLQATEGRIDADLRLGRHGELVGELQALIDANPLIERLHALLMLALYRAGRQGEALAAYQHARRVVVGELGLEPGAELHRLQQQILAGDPQLTVSADSAGVQPLSVALRRPAGSGRTAEAIDDPGHATSSDCGPGSVVPHQLPAAPRHFVGRKHDMEKLAGLVNDVGTSGTVIISTIGGTAGVGKTALALQFAHQVAEKFADGQLYADLRSFDPTIPPLAPDVALRGFLDAFGIRGRDLPPDMAARAALYRSLLADRQALIVLDNAASTSQVQPLIPGSPGCMVIVTSRNRLASLVAQGAETIALDGLTSAEAHEMLACRLGAGRIAAEPAAVSELTDLCARLPLALAIVAARATAQPGLPLAVLAAELRDDDGRLDALNAGEPGSDIRAVFSWSYGCLTSETSRMFRLLGAHPGPDITAMAAASLAGVALAPARRMLDALARASLLVEYVPGRYRFHDLLRAYAWEQAVAADQGDERIPDQRAALSKLFDYYLASASAAIDIPAPAELAVGYRRAVLRSTPACSATFRSPPPASHARSGRVGGADR